MGEELALPPQDPPPVALGSPSYPPGLTWVGRSPEEARAPSWDAGCLSHTRHNWIFQTSAHSATLASV